MACQYMYVICYNVQCILLVILCFLGENLSLQAPWFLLGLFAIFFH